ncbi:Inositol transporter 4 [Bienertia sinuspersici]
MVEGGVVKADKTEFTECFKTLGKTPYIFKACFFCWHWSLLFVMTQVVISGALLYIKDEFKDVDKKTWLQKFVGVGVGMASMTSPLYISETSPSKIRGALVSTNGLLITGGQFLAYLINLGFTQGAAIPAFVQLILMLSLPESPRWLYRKNLSPEELDEEIKTLKGSVDIERVEEEGAVGGGNFFSKLKKAWGSQVFRRGLCAGVTVQVAQQFVGINTVMYYSPTIVQLAGIASKSTALALSLITSGLNAVGTVVSMMFVDRHGRRRLMIISMAGIITCLIALAVLNPGACLTKTDKMKAACDGEQRVYFTAGCPSKFGFLAVILLGAYIISYSPGIGTVPWIVNSEIYPLKYRGVGGGIAAVANWSSNLIVSETFLTLTEALGSAGTFLLFAGFSIVGLVSVYFLVPETKGLPMEEIEHMLEKGLSQVFLVGLKKSKTKIVNLE